MVEDTFQLRALYGQIIVGCTPTKVDNAPAYIKHFSPLEQGELDGGYSAFLENAVSRGLDREKTKLETLFADKLWTEKDETFIEHQQLYIRGLIDTKKNIALPSQVEEQNVLIREAQKVLGDKMQDRNMALGLTAEAFARKKLNELYILKSLFQDRECRTPLFSDEDFDYLDSNQLNDIAAIFNDSMAHCNDNSIKKIALAPFFQNSFTLCDDNIYNFFGKPIITLTFYQSELAGYGRFFKHILSSESKPPAEILADPEKIIDWFNTNKNTEKMMKANNSSNVAVFGATQEDMKQLSKNHGEIVSFEKAAGGKKTVRGRDFMKMLK